MYVHFPPRLALETAVQTAETQLLSSGEAGGQTSTPPSSHNNDVPGGRAETVRAALRAELKLLDIDWFVSVLSRLHINVFRVGCMVPPSGRGGDGRVAGAVGGRPPAMGAMTSGSTAFLVASLFNHSCEPNVEVVFRRNDSTATFVAARDIDQVGWRLETYCC